MMNSPPALPAGFTSRPLRESDHLPVIAAVGEWWGTPQAPELGLLLPRLFFQHFTVLSEVVEVTNEGSGPHLAAFLIAFHSATHPDRVYIHFVGVDPQWRGRGIAAGLYERLFSAARGIGCTRVDAITSPANRGSQAFHEALGFTTHGDQQIEGVTAYADYDGPGHARVALMRTLD
ncbi:GNAT family N-acetyltransferase [Microcella sp.]|uniref:GNAT family N-acetyltransferase n=1 Tax=Microcella sp. TaxID=1913979 RepID=UPI00255D8BB7|nr:GNAT family N-acetyltransferase [Microcella sp.]MBX9470762.1 GNAT family N-acetyltransferase [Microcella sp.]